MKKILSMAVSFVLVLSLAGCSSAEAKAWQEQYDLGVKYLSELNYEEAVVAFTKAIEIDPKQAEVYLKLARIYMEQGASEKAKEMIAESVAVQAEQNPKPILWEPAETVKTEKSNGEYEEKTYAPNGKLYSDITYSADGKVVREIYYNANTDIVKHTDYNEDGTISFTVEKYRGSRYNIRTEYENNLPVHSIVYENNMNDVELDIYYRDGIIEHDVAYRNNGKVDRERFYSEKGIISKIKSYSEVFGYYYLHYESDFDENGVEISTTYYDTNGNVEQIIYYNADGSEASRVRYDTKPAATPTPAPTPVPEAAPEDSGIEVLPYSPIIIVDENGNVIDEWQAEFVG